MSDAPAPLKITHARHEARLKLPAMYTLLRARRVGDTRYRWTGYIYDISVAGMRFELDKALEPGTRIGADGIEESYDEFAHRATVTAYLSLLAEKFARQRL